MSNMAGTMISVALVECRQDPVVMATGRIVLAESNPLASMKEEPVAMSMLGIENARAIKIIVPYPETTGPEAHPLITVTPHHQSPDIVAAQTPRQTWRR